MRYGVPKELVELVRLKGIGKARALKLLNIGIPNKSGILENRGKAEKLLGKKVILDALKEEIA